MAKNSYKNNFLKEVIFRLDFSEDIQLNFVDEFFNKTKLSFPLFEQKDGREAYINIDVKNESINPKFKKTVLWLFHNKMKSKFLEITSKHLVLHYKKYKNYKELQKNIESIVLTFIKAYNIKVVKRIGLRYKNEIKLPENNYLNWKNYINNNFLGTLEFSDKNKKTVARLLTLLVLKEKEANINFQFGIPNKNYPNAVNSKEFILDFDCYSNIPLNIEETNLIEKVNLYHEYIEELFELSITKKFRDLLNK